MTAAAHARAPSQGTTQPRRVKSHTEVLRGNAGAAQNPITFVEGRLADAELEHQTRVIAKKLEAAGWEPRRSDADDVVSIGLVSGTVLRNGGWRNSNILPAVAKRNRAGMLAAFGMWQTENPRAREYCRLCVVTSGPRCSLEELPERLRWFNERLGRFAERAKKPRWSVEVQLVALEVTFRREDDGGVSCHLHANVVYWPRRRLEGDGWSRFLVWMRKHFKVSQIEDAGTLDDPEEVIKYVTKPSEVLQLTSDETRFLAETLHRKQIVRTFNTFGDYCKELREAHEKIRFDREDKTWTRMQMRTREQADRDDVERTNRESEEKKKDAGGAEPIENQLLFQTLPQARTSLLAESFVGVRNYNPNPTTDAGKRNLAILEERRAAFLGMLVDKNVENDAIRAAAYRLDTCTKIPLDAAMTFPALPVKRRERVLRQVGIPEELVPRYVNGGAVMELADLFRAKLERILPKEAYPWAVPAEEIVDNLRERKRREASVDAFVKALRDAMPGAEITVHDAVDSIDEDATKKVSDPAPVRPGSLRERAMTAAAERRKAQVKGSRAAG